MFFVESGDYKVLKNIVFKKFFVFPPWWITVAEGGTIYSCHRLARKGKKYCEIKFSNNF